MDRLGVTLIGTGATTPSPARALASALVQIGGLRVLVDCGEGTQVALQRSAGIGPALIDTLFVTHYHADHYLGIAGLVKTRSGVEEIDPLVIYALPQVIRHLEPHLHSSFTSGYELIALDGDVELTHEWSVQPVEVLHTVPATGLVFRERDLPGRFDPQRARADGAVSGPDLGVLARGGDLQLSDGRVLRGSDYIGPARPGRCVAVSGDTAPCSDFARAAHGAELIVHEATFANEHAERAGQTLHSTAGGAGQIAHEAGAKELWLTHLSSRYAGAGQGANGLAWNDLETQARQVFGGTVRIGRDGMNARISPDEVLTELKRKR